MAILFQLLFVEEPFLKRMIDILARKKIFVLSFLFALFMCIVVLLFINPYIDGSDGTGMIKLQLSFNKQSGIQEVESWGQGGIDRYNQLIFTDYIFAFSYALFLSCVLSILLKKKNIESRVITYVISLPYFAALFDWIEDSMQWRFINAMSDYSDILFVTHSIMASMKFICLLISFIVIAKLLLVANKERT